MQIVSVRKYFLPLQLFIFKYFCCFFCCFLLLLANGVRPWLGSKKHEKRREKTGFFSFFLFLFFLFGIQLKEVKARPALIRDSV